MAKIFQGLGPKRRESSSGDRVYLDSLKSSAKDLSLPKFEIEISHKTFDGKSSSHATGPRPNACHARARPTLPQLRLLP